MIILNFYASPGSGKSTTSAYIFSQLKMRTDLKVELVGEEAKDQIYKGSPIQLENQIFLLGCQYRRLKDLERHGIEVCISDSPLAMQLNYCKHMPYYKEISALNKKLDSEFENFNVFIRRVKKFQSYGRIQSEAESDALSTSIWDSMNGSFDYVMKGDIQGCEDLAGYLIQRKFAERKIST